MRGRSKKAPATRVAGAEPEGLEQVVQELREVSDVDGAETRGGTVAVAALVEPVVAVDDRVKWRMRALVGLTGKSQGIERIVE